MRQGTAGVVADYRAFGSDWGFTPEVVSAPVSVWQGEADGLVPLAHGERLASQLPAGTLHRVPGAGHFLHATHGQTRSCPCFGRPLAEIPGHRLRRHTIGSDRARNR